MVYDLTCEDVRLTIEVAQRRNEDGLGEWVVEVAHSANVVVLRTPPGSAHVVGSALDRSGLEEVVGTVAGDDTVLVVVDEQVGGDVMAARLRDVAGIAATNRIALNGKDED